MEKRIVLSIGMLLLLASVAYGAVIWSDEVFTLFETTSTKPRCIDDGEHWEYWDPSLLELVQTSSLEDCYKEEVADGSTQKCCPYNELRCNKETDKCELPSVDFCENYTEEECNEDDFDVGVATVERSLGKGWCSKTNGAVIAGITCSWKNIDCRCTWKADATGTGGSCISYYNTTAMSCMNGTDDDKTGSCELYLIEKLDNCATTGFITFRSKVEWIQFPLSPRLPGADDCINPPEITYRCPATLPFITYAGIAIAVVLIILIYFIFYKKMKKGK